MATSDLTSTLDEAERASVVIEAGAHDESVRISSPRRALVACVAAPKLVEVGVFHSPTFVHSRPVGN